MNIIEDYISYLMSYLDDGVNFTTLVCKMKFVWMFKIEESV